MFRTVNPRELYENLFEKSFSVMLVIDPENGEIIDANLAAAEFYGYSKNELKSLKITDINILSQHQVYEEMEAARSQKRNYFNFKHKLKNGIIRDVEVYCGPVNLLDRQLLYSIIHDVTEKNRLADERDDLIVKLEKAFIEIKSLHGIIPICANCKKIRDDQGYWTQLETFLREHSDADFTHSLCPECVRALYPGIADRIINK